jgi:hypothetical protein
MEILDLSIRGIKTLAGVKFPSGLEELYLTGNNLKTLADVQFPAGLKRLDLRYNNLTTKDTWQPAFRLLPEWWLYSDWLYNLHIPVLAGSL